ncbi:MAG: diaminopimelate epimerase [Acidimicrobiaceae bacterium]|nr:diaminopimelate epimerase [Acidimicrobiaceae bacterium]
MATMHLIKYEGLGNTFLVAIEDAIPTNGGDIARSVCDPSNGFNADGLIFGTPPLAEDIDIQMTLFNADGTLAEMSGNGIRCLAQETFSRFEEKTKLQILTDSGIRNVSLNNLRGEKAEITVEMGPIRGGPDLPHLDFLKHPSISIVRVATADIGNPHVVIEVESLDGVDVAGAGSHIESLWKPVGINVHFVKAENSNQLSMLTWERGAGVTLACGTGAAASSYVAHEWGLVDKDVDVVMAGGQARIVLSSEKVILTGSSSRIAEFEVSLDG